MSRKERKKINIFFRPGESKVEQIWYFRHFLVRLWFNRAWRHSIANRCAIRLLTARLLTANEQKKTHEYKKFDGQRVERHPRRPCFAACAQSRGENPRTATANERRSRAVIGRYYKRGRRRPGTVSCTSDRAARGCAGERPSERASGDAGESRRECDPTSRLLAMQRSSRACPPSEENRVKRGGWRAAMTGAGASSDIVPRHANRARHAVNIAI